MFIAVLVTRGCVLWDPHEKHENTIRKRELFKESWLNLQTIKGPSFINKILGRVPLNSRK